MIITVASGKGGTGKTTVAVGLAQALVGDPELIVLDEPTAGLDPVGARLVKDLLLRLRGLGRTIFLSSHILGEVEEVADRIGILFRGELICEGALAALMAGRKEELITPPLTPYQLARLKALLQELGAGEVYRGHWRVTLEEFFLEKIGAK